MRKPIQLNPYWYAWRAVMRLAHRFDWHYMEHCYPDGDHMIWCHWCGARYVIPKQTTAVGKGEAP